MHGKVLEELVKVISADFDDARIKVALLRFCLAACGRFFELDSEFAVAGGASSSARRAEITMVDRVKDLLAADIAKLVRGHDTDDQEPVARLAERREHERQVLCPAAPATTRAARVLEHAPDRIDEPVRQAEEGRRVLKDGQVGTVFDDGETVRAEKVDGALVEDVGSLRDDSAVQSHRERQRMPQQSGTGRERAV